MNWQQTWGQRLPALRALRARLGRESWPVLIILTVCLGGLWFFFELADEVVEGSTRELDRTVLLLLRTPGQTDDPLGPFWLEELAEDLTALGGYTVLTLFSLIAFGFLLLLRRLRLALGLAAAVGGAMLLNNFLKIGFNRPRPDLVSHGVEVYSLSFPSGHAMLSAAVYLTLGALLAEAQSQRRLRTYIITVTILLALAIGVTRVYLGVHWPSDVLAGWALGSAWALAWWLLVKFVRRSSDS